MFESCGLPGVILLDRGTAWWNWQPFSGSTHLSLWRMRLGVKLCWSGIGHLQTQGEVELFHGSLQRALDRRDGADPLAWLDDYRAEYCQKRPHEALDMQTPASRWIRSNRSYNPAPPPWEYPEGARLSKVDYQATTDLQEGRWRTGKTLAGEQVMIQPIEHRNLIYFCATMARKSFLPYERQNAKDMWRLDGFQAWRGVPDRRQSSNMPRMAKAVFRGRSLAGTSERAPLTGRADSTPNFPSLPFWPTAPVTL